MTSLDAEGGLVGLLAERCHLPACPWSLVRCNQGWLRVAAPIGHDATEHRCCRQPVGAPVRVIVRAEVTMGAPDPPHRLHRHSRCYAGKTRCRPKPRDAPQTRWQHCAPPWQLCRRVSLFGLTSDPCRPFHYYGPSKPKCMDAIHAQNDEVRSPCAQVSSRPLHHVSHTENC